MARVALASLLAASLWFRVDDACAQSAEENAATLFRQGAAAYGAGDYRAAAEAFERAYASSHDASMLHNLALAREHAGDVEGAIESYRAFLDAHPEAPERGEVELSLATLERLRAAETARGDVEDEVEDEVETPRETPALVREPPPSHRDVAAAPFVIAGIGVAGLGVAIGLSLFAEDRNAAAIAEPVQETALALEADRDRIALAANILYGVGGAVTLAGAIWAVVDVLETDSANRGRPHVAMSIGPGRVVLSGSF